MKRSNELQQRRLTVRSPRKILLSVLVLVSGVWTGSGLSQDALPQLVDIGQSAGFNLVGHGRGTAWADLDGDGLIDFAVGLMADGLLHPGGFWYYRNLGNDKFEEHRDLNGVVIDDTVYGVTLPDVDNDGDSDVFVNCGGYQVTAPFPEKNRLFLNDGHGVLTARRMIEAGVTTVRDCGNELDFIRAVLPEARVERTSHIIEGARHCAYDIARR